MTNIFFIALRTSRPVPHLETKTLRNWGYFKILKEWEDFKRVGASMSLPPQRPLDGSTLSKLVMIGCKLQSSESKSIPVLIYSIILLLLLGPIRECFTADVRGWRNWTVFFLFRNCQTCCLLSVLNWCHVNNSTRRVEYYSIKIDSKLATVTVVQTWLSLSWRIKNISLLYSLQFRVWSMCIKFCHGCKLATVL